MSEENRLSKEEEKTEILKKLAEVLQKAFEERQDSPYQFVVAYYKKSDDSLIGYHLNTFCEITNDIIEAKRYAAEDPYPQLGIIYKNIKYTLSAKAEDDSLFSSMRKKIKANHFDGLTIDDIWIDAVYLADGMPKQNHRFIIVNPNE